MNTKAYPIGGIKDTQTLVQINTLKEYLISIKKDPIIEILLKNSCLTEIQLETLLLDLYNRENRDHISKELKTIQRIDKKISRGAFNRTRNQAIRNIVKSIYTIMLFGYIGLLETPQLEPFIEVSGRLKSFKENIKLYNNYELKNNVLKTLINEIEEMASGRGYYKK